MKTKNILSTLIVLFIFITSAVAQGNLVTADQLKGLKKEHKDNFVLIDASKTKLYTKAHIDGAISIPYKALNQKEGAVKGLIKTPEELAAFFGKMGVSDQDFIVIYDEGSQKYSTRVFWVLKYLGAPNVKILHKEMGAFRKARVKLTSNVSSPKAKTFTANVNKDIVVDLAYVKANLDNIVLIDVRTAKEFTGSDDVKKKYSEGHLPGAIHLDFKKFEKEDKSFLSPEGFSSIAEKHGFTPEKTYVMYCKTGVKASVAYVFFTEVLGYKNVKVYEGAYLEWAAQGEAIEK